VLFVLIQLQNQEFVSHLHLNLILDFVFDHILDHILIPILDETLLFLEMVDQRKQHDLLLILMAVDGIDSVNLDKFTLMLQFQDDSFADQLDYYLLDEIYFDSL
jgi:hypothetical protein